MKKRNFFAIYCWQKNEKEVHMVSKVYDVNLNTSGQMLKQVFYIF